MKNHLFQLTVLLICTTVAPEMRASTTFAGALLTGQNDGLAAGNIILTVNGGQVSFQSTLFQQWVTNTSLQPALEMQGAKIPFALGVGTPGNWALTEFLAPVPGASASSPPGAPGSAVDPGFQIPPRADGTRFTGSFETFPHLEHALLVRGGAVELQVYGTVVSLQNPILTARLQNVTAPIPVQFTVTFSGLNEIPHNASLHHGTGSFILTGNELAYTLAMDLGFAWTSAGIYGPAAPRSNLPNLVSELGTSTGVVTSGQPGLTAQGVYSGRLSLTGAQVEELMRGRLYVNFATARYPKGELRGQILPAAAPAHEMQGH